MTWPVVVVCCPQVQDAWLRAQQQAEELTEAVRAERQERAAMEERARGLEEGEKGGRGGGSCLFRFAATPFKLNPFLFSSCYPPFLPSVPLQTCTTTSASLPPCTPSAPPCSTSSPSNRREISREKGTMNALDSG